MRAGSEAAIRCATKTLSGYADPYVASPSESLRGQARPAPARIRMALGDIRPDRVRLGRREKIQVDSVTRCGDRGEDVVAVHSLAARHAHRGDRERVEPRCEKANRSVVTEMFVHSAGAEVPDRSTPAGRRVLPASGRISYKILKKESSQQSIVLLQDMWRISAVFVAVAVAASTAGAAHGAVAKTSGAVYLQLSDGGGLAKVRNRGTFIGQVKRGKIIASSNVNLNGCESKKKIGGNMVRCRGRAITFNTIGADRWRVRLRGRGIYGSGFVRGCLVLDGRNSGPTGTFRRGMADDGAPWPRSRTRYKLGSGSC